jgi:hypothetical protein
MFGRGAGFAVGLGVGRGVITGVGAGLNPDPPPEATAAPISIMMSEDTVFPALSMNVTVTV